MFETVRHLIRKEFIQTFRDRRMLMPIFVAPIIQLILFGYAATTDIKHISLGILDHDRSQESRTLISEFAHSRSFTVAALLSSSDEMSHMIQDSEVQAALVIPDRFGEKLSTGTGTSVQIIVDGTDANTATIILGYISQLIGKHVEGRLASSGENLPAGRIQAEPRIWFNPQLKSSFYMVPGVICLILLLTTLALTSMAITRERELGTLEQLIVSPLKPWELIMGKTAPFILIGLGEIVLILIAGRMVFGIPLRGNILFLFGVSFLFILTTLSMGIFISTVSRTQQQAMMTAFFFIMPAMLLSGIFSPIESMPRLIQYITWLNPLRYFSQAVRGILLKGNGFPVLWHQVAALLTFGVAASVLSSLRFKKHLE